MSVAGGAVAGASGAAGGAGRRVVVVTGGGAGIGAAVATELGRRGAHVVTVDPMVALDGSALPAAGSAPGSGSGSGSDPGSGDGDPGAGAEDTTAGRIVAAGGSAEALAVSVTDPALGDLFAGLVARHGRLDAVVNVAGITRPTSFARGREEDWREVVHVHLGGYLNVLRSALPLMAAAGHGRILGVTSGSGWRAADAGAYSCAKRAVAALTWQLGAAAPPGVTINALSPIAVTRMVTEALRRAGATAPRGGSGGSSGSGGAGGGGGATGGLSLGSMPAPEELGPLAAHLVDEALDWMTGEVLFAAGSEVALVAPPRLVEVVALPSDPAALPALLDGATSQVLVPAEAAQASTGGANPRLTPPRTAAAGADGAGGGGAAPAVRTALVVTDRPDLADAVTTALAARGVTSTGQLRGGAGGPAFDGSTFGDGARALALSGAVDAVVVALGNGSVPIPGAVGPGTPERDRHGQVVDQEARAAAPPWARVLDDHDELEGRIPADAGWARAVADVAAAEDRPVRLVTLVDARTAGGRSRAQAVAQLARAARRATGERVAALSVAVEAPDLALGGAVAGAPGGGPVGAMGEVAAHLACSPAAADLSGAELVLADGWLGLRSHPRPGTGIALAGPDVPPWFDTLLRDLVGRPGRDRPEEAP